MSIAARRRAVRRRRLRLLYGTLLALVAGATWWTTSPAPALAGPAPATQERVATNRAAEAEPADRAEATDRIGSVAPAALPARILTGVDRPTAVSPTGSATGDRSPPRA